MRLHTYLNYGGNCAEAFRFYEHHLGGKITTMMTRAGSPNPHDPASERADSIQYASMELGGTQLMGADVPPDRFQPMRSAYLSLSLGSTEEAERIYHVLGESGDIFMPLQETFFAFRFAMLRDRFGTSWMLLYPRPQDA
jgi:PhnB protein